MKFVLLFIFVLSLIACSSGSFVGREPAATKTRSWKMYLEEEVLRPNGLQEFFPDSDLLSDWTPSSEIVFEKESLNPSEIPELSLACFEDELWPTHPQQTTKDYLYAVYANYQHLKLPAGSDVCLTWDSKKRSCLRAAIARMVVMSDTFQDNCGNYYRGYWVVGYLKHNENMGTLLSKGRTVYDKLNASFPEETYTGDTYSTKVSDFLFLGPLLPRDKAQISHNRQQAFRQGYHIKGNAFVR